MSYNKENYEELLRSPEWVIEDSNSDNKRERRKMPSKELLKAKLRYRTKVGTCNRLEGRFNQKEKEDGWLASADDK